MIEDAVRALLQGKNFCHLVTRRRDGSPRVVVIWVDADDEHVLLNGQEGERHWIADVRRDPAVICTVVNMDDPYEYVTIHGRVVGDTHEGANEHIDALAQRYWGTDYGLPEGKQRVIVRVAPERVRHRKPG